MKLTFILANNGSRCLAVSLPIVPGLCDTSPMVILLHRLIETCLTSGSCIAKNRKNNFLTLRSIFDNISTRSTRMEAPVWVDLNKFAEFLRVKMSNAKGWSRDRNICRIGCGRPGQGDYGWKGPAFNCCFGTVACLVEHKRPVRHASVAWTCEYLPHQWNAPLPPHLPYKPSVLTLIFTALSTLWAPVLLTWGGNVKTHTYMSGAY